MGSSRYARMILSGKYWGVSMFVTYKQVVDLYIGLSVLKGLGDKKFSYAVNKNLANIKPIMDALDKVHRAYYPFLVYDHERTQLAKKYAVIKDGVLQTKLENGVVSFVIENEAEFNKEVKKLQEKHKEAIEDRKDQLDQFKKHLQDEISIDLYTIPKSYLPENLSDQQLANIKLIIKE